MKRRKHVSFRPRRLDDTYKDLGNEPRWFVMQIQPQMQKTADFNLRNQNFDSFFPRVQFRRNGSILIEWMFKGYGFVLFNPVMDAWSSINGTRGVVGLLPRFSLYPTPVPAGFVENLKDNDPLVEAEFMAVFDQYFPGITKVVVKDNHYFLGGRSGLVIAVRSKLLQISFDDASNPIWLDREYVVKKEI